jgi:hypothetical protein
MFIICTDSERLLCGGFSLGETIPIGSLDFIVDYFGGLSLSPKRSNPCTVFMGSTHSGSPSLRAMIEDSTEEFYTASSREGGSGLPFSQRHDTGGSACSHHNDIMARGHIGHSGHDDSSTTCASIVARHRPPL